jgi:hypothetical protein
MSAIVAHKAPSRISVSTRFHSIEVNQWLKPFQQVTSRRFREMLAKVDSSVLSVESIGSQLDDKVQKILNPKLSGVLGQLSPTAPSKTKGLMSAEKAQQVYNLWGEGEVKVTERRREVE